MENVNFFDNALIDDGDYPEDIIPINQNVPVLSFLDAEISVNALINYCDGLKVPKEEWFFLEQFSRQIRSHRSLITKSGPNIDSFFGSKHKPK